MILKRAAELERMAEAAVINREALEAIEPLIKPQWWMRMNEMAEAAVKAVDEGKITIAPETANKSYKRWLSSINDWCLSRQLWYVES